MENNEEGRTSIGNALEVYYKNIKGALEYVTNEERVEQYKFRISDGEKDSFDSIITHLIEKLNDVLEIEEEGEVFQEFNSLEEYFINLFENYPDYINANSKLLILFFAVCRKISELDVTQLNELNLPTEEFVLIPLDTGVKDFIFTNEEVNNTIILVSLDEMDNFSLDNVATNVLLYFLDKINLGNSTSDDNKLCFVSSSLAEKEHHLQAFIELNKVAAGEEIHTPYNYINLPSITSEVNWDIQHGYNQFTDVIYILSEYNYQKNIIDKYLKIYQVIENFMYKMPICEIVNSSGEMFSVREFKNLYSKVSEKEMAALKKFLETVFKEEYNTGINFKQHINTKWVNFTLDSSVNILIDEGLSKIGVSFTCQNVNQGNLYDFCSQLIYKLRNSIVHNKETEFHLTYGNLGEFPGIQNLLENFLFNVLEEIIYSLIINKNPLISYLHPNLKLYKS